MFVSAKSGTFIKMDKEQLLKHQIIASAESVRRKVKKMRDIKSNNELILESVLKPITGPLNQMTSKSSQLNSKIYDEITPNAQCSIKKRRILKRDNTVKRQTLAFDQENDKANERLYFADSENENNSNIDIGNVTPASSNSSIIDNDVNTSATSFKTSETMSPSWSLCSDMFHDVPYGVRRERGKLLLGMTRVTLNDDKIIIGRLEYLKTPGLIELLFKKSPDLGLITEDDKQMYKTMLIDTNAHRRNFDSTKAIKGNKGRKYMQIIKPLFMKLAKNCISTESLSHGSGLRDLHVKKHLKKNVDYIYWDDPNELVDRLKLLVASRDAGNTGLNNEIISVIEELRESGIIN